MTDIMPTKPRARGLANLSFGTIRTQLAALFVIAGILPAAGIFGTFAWLEDDFRAEVRGPLQQTAENLGTTIDRNLFERYGDVQAFGLNAAVQDPANWRNASPDNPLVAAMNGYMTGYGIYRLMLVVDPSGRVVAVNSIDPKGRSLDTMSLYGMSVAGTAWFQDAMSGRFLEGSNGLTGTVVTQPARDEAVADLYGDDGYSLVFAAPFKDRAGNVLGVWANFADFGLVDEIVATAYERLAARGFDRSEITVLDPEGLVIVDYDPATFSGQYRRDHTVIGALNLVEKGVPAAVAAVKGESGAADARHARKGVWQAAGYAHTHGAYDYPGLGWSVLVRVDQDQAYATVLGFKRTMLFGLGVAAAIVLLAGLWLGSLFAKPIARVTSVVEKLAQGDEAVEVSATARRDEIGRLWRAMVDLKKTVGESFRLRTMVDEMPINVMMADPKNDFRIVYINKTSINTLRAIEHLLPVKADQVANSSIDIFHKNPAHQRRILADPSNLPYAAKIKVGPETLDLRVSAIRDKDGSYIGPMVSWQVITKQVKMIDDFEANVKVVVDTVASASTELQSNAQSMSATAEETNRQAGAVAAASEQATANVQTVAAAAEELSSSIVEIGRQVSQSASIASMAVDEAKKTDATVQGLSEAAQKIGEVVRLISDIASQTNLLALNATIEAARAGEAGKGFAVVASEVKSLATQTAKATEEIAAQIGAIQASTKDAVSAIQSIGKTIAEINDIAATISAAVEEQGAATQEIARNVQEASAGTTEVSSNISGVTQAAGETGSAASQVLSAADELSAQSEKLKTEVEGFLATVRAA